MAISSASASASDRSIKLATKAFRPVIVDEERLAASLTEFKSTGNPAPAQAILTICVKAFHALKEKIGAQKARSPRHPR